MAIDGHSHLEFLHQRVSSKATIESALEALAECHASTVLAGSEGVVTNSVFQNEWTARMPASVGTIRGLQTWGVHPKAVGDADWNWLEKKMATPECVAVGECGLEETARDMEL